MHLNVQIYLHMAFFGDPVILETYFRSYSFLLDKVTLLDIYFLVVDFSFASLEVLGEGGSGWGGGTVGRI